ncbi:hypothetical protein niasHS_009505 [Heterodera schachtii]|uniref:BTB domain-containing protein n=1 Tax=Heterodera schachtii TaxID=97005 RepID=A0ABD2J2I5_HETSC
MSKAGIAGLKLILSTGEYADVHFLVGDGDAKELVPAHKHILKFASDVFEAMFRFEANKEHGKNVSANCSVVEIPDIEAAAFKVMLSFIYTEDLNELNGDNAMAVLYAAKKYIIPPLVNASLQIPISELRNVFLAYAQARLFGLEDFANDCLSYIDKNAEILIKSVGFLQINQKLLCEILERDELQMNDEISVWQAFSYYIFIFFTALRWADEKCCENGIECSAENRRQMLGPALFTIRFPLFSHKEFTVQIVPSGILTVDEVVSIEQYHTNSNFCGTSDGLLYPLQFPSHERIKAFGTLLMDIEKVSEFAREAVGSSWFSEKVYINGLSWRIWAQIKTKNGSTNTEKYLGIYLLFDTPEEDLFWRCNVHSATIRIISPKNGVDNSIGTFCDHVFDNKSTSLGFANFISFAELMDPSRCFYDSEEDKVTLCIDLTVKKEKIHKFVLNQSKSNGTLFMEIEKVSEFAREVIGSERKSETVHIKGFPWQILAQIEKKDHSTNNNEKCLDIFLLCDAPKKENWSCQCSAIIRIVSQKNDVLDYKAHFNDQLFNNEMNVWGISRFFSFAQLMDTSKGFYNQNEDKVTLAIDFIIKEAKMDKA